MGYYTSYSIDFECEPGFEQEEEDFKEALISEAEKYNYGPEVKELYEFGVYTKMYDIDVWISELAPNYPHLLIILSGDGEESNDLWEVRWKGKDREIQECIIPPFTNCNLFTKREKEQLNKTKKL